MNFLKNKFKRNWIFSVLFILVAALVIMQHMQYMPFIQENFDSGIRNISNINKVDIPDIKMLDIKKPDIKMPDIKKPDSKVQVPAPEVIYNINTKNDDIFFSKMNEIKQNNKSNYFNSIKTYFDTFFTPFLI